MHLQKAEGILKHENAMKLFGTDRCVPCQGRGKKSTAENADDPLRQQFDERYGVCVVIAGEKGCCTRCRWRNRDQECEFRLEAPQQKELKPDIGSLSLEDTNRAEGSNAAALAAQAQAAQAAAARNPYLPQGWQQWAPPPFPGPFGYGYMGGFGGPSGAR